MNAVWENVDDLTAQFDASVRLEGGSGCAWSAEVRLTLTNPEAAPSRSITFYTVGHDGPEQAAAALLDDVKAWLTESDVKPLPVPAWMRRD